MTTPSALRQRCSRVAQDLQNSITERLEALSGAAFREDEWGRAGGGGGRTRILLDDELFEKGGVSFSEVHGDLPEAFAKELGEGEERSFYATGISLVLHPRSPRVPTVHANFRYIEKGDSWWFGGGADLTPYRFYEEDACHFHRVWKDVCDRHDPDYYPRFKKWCDEYFYLPHRKEKRGVGGIFFDYLSGETEQLFDFWTEVGGSFLDAYVPIVERRRSEAFDSGEREHQLLRRGRYVEFNLLYDRGTRFGLKTGGRSESILMSLPPEVRWGYDTTPKEGPEAELLEVLKNSRDWV